MSRRCQLTGREPGFGKKVSHSHVRTNRRFDPDIQDRRYWLPSEGRYVRLRLSTKAIKTVDRSQKEHADRGIESVVARLRAAGQKV